MCIVLLRNRIEEKKFIRYMLEKNGNIGLFFFKHEVFPDPFANVHVQILIKINQITNR